MLIPPKITERSTKLDPG